MKKIFFSVMATIFWMVNSVQAQYEFYPSTFGRLTANGGTARYTAIGGAGTSLGADLGAAYVNPAGLGMYPKSEFSFSPNFGFSGSNTSFLDESNRDTKGSFSLSNLGVAICGAKDDLDKSDWRGGTFSLGMSRTNSFHNRISFSGVDDQSTMADYFVQQANGTPVSEYIDNQSPYDPNSSGIASLGALAWYAFMINAVPPDYSQYHHDINDETVLKEGTYTTKGAQYQWNIAYGANYKDKLYIGGGLGITSINFREDLTYTETIGYKVNGNFVPSPDTIDNFTFNDYNKVKGTGVNFKLGYIYKISDVVRIGTTVTTPTYNWMNQEYSSDLSVVYNQDGVDTTGGGNYPLGTQSQSTAPGFFKFSYTTPVKIAIGTSFFAGKSGFISADIEYIPYQLSDLSGRNSADDKYLKTYNKIVTSSYQNVLNLRLGGELRVDIFRLRAGLAYLPNPYKYSDKVNRDIAQISGGVGIKLNDVYFDLGIVNNRFESSYRPYSLNNITTSSAVSKNSTVNIVLTMGLYFE